MVKKVFICVFCGSRSYSLTYKDIVGSDDNQYDLCKCDNCGLSQITPLPSESSLMNYYSQFYDGRVKKNILSDGGVEENKAAIDDGFKKLKAVFKKTGVNQGKLLDVGCGNGFFIYAAKHWGYNCVGVDVDTDAIDYAEKKMGIQIVKDDIYNYQKINDSYDVVTIWMVLEHLRNPFLAIQEAVKKVKKGGILVGSVPNIDGVGHFVQKHKWYLLVPPEHLIYFNNQTIEKFLKKAGLTPVFIGTIPLYAFPYIKFGIRRIIGNMSIRTKNIIAKFVLKKIHRILTYIKRYLFYFPLNLIICMLQIPGNSIFFIARKEVENE